MSLNLLNNKDRSGRWMPPAFSPEIVIWHSKFFVSPWILDLHVDKDAVPMCLGSWTDSPCTNEVVWWNLHTRRHNYCAHHIQENEKHMIQDAWFRTVYTINLIVLGQKPEAADLFQENSDIVSFSESYRNQKKHRQSNDHHKVESATLLR